MSEHYEIAKSQPPLITISPQSWAIAITPHDGPHAGKHFNIGYDGTIDASPDFAPSEAALLFAQAVGPILAGYRDIRCTCAAAHVLHEKTCATFLPPSTGDHR